MDLASFLKSLPNFIEDLGWMFIQIPKTLWMVLTKPKWIPRYIRADQASEEKKEHPEYTSPVMFWLVTGVLSYFAVIHFMIEGFAGKDIRAAYHAMGTTKIVSSLAVYFLSLPLSCAVVLQWFKHKTIDKYTFKNQFHIQCYCFAPVQLFYIPAFMCLFVDQHSSLMIWGVLFALLSFGWFFYAEGVIISQVLNAGIWKVIGVMIVMYFVSFFFISISTGLFILMNLEPLGNMGDAVFGNIGADSISVIPVDTIPNK